MRKEEGSNRFMHDPCVYGEMVKTSSEVGIGDEPGGKEVNISNIEVWMVAENMVEVVMFNVSIVDVT